MIRASSYALALLISIVISSCGTEQGTISPDSAFTPYISAFTAGHISARSPIVVRIADDQRWNDTTGIAVEKLFHIVPTVSGKVVWQDSNTLVFQPTERLDQDKTYTVSFKLGELIEMPKGLEVFRFQVSTFRQGINVEVSEMRSMSATEMQWQRVILSVRTSDDATGQDIEATIQASQLGRTLPLTWEHEPNGRFHRCILDSVERGDHANVLNILWDARTIGSDDKGQLDFNVPAIGDLVLISASTESDGEQVAKLDFSDPLDRDQELTGLAGIAGTEAVRIDIVGNTLLLYPRKRLSGDVQAFVAASLRNVNGKTLGKELSVELTFEELKPAVRLVDSGTILPSSDGLVMPFEAVNLNAVEVRIIHIHESNIGQFLQVNALSGERELARVGRLVARKTLDLRTTDAPDLGRWNRYHLDLEQYFRSEPGAIYRVELSFGKQHSAYPCEGDKTETLQREKSWESEQEAYDNIQNYWYYDDYYFEDYWEEEEDGDRRDPCSKRYFADQRKVSRNILASDLGLIAKRGNDGSMMLAVSDLRSTATMSGVKLEVLDLQRKSMGSVITDGEGLATLPPTRNKPFLLVASKGTQRGYLKLDDGSSLSISEFDVSGETIDRGLKGFLYGERGVWRPGDSLFLTFVLQDAIRKLPKDHPVVLELSDPRGRLDQRIVRTSGTNGMYTFQLATHPDAPTGIWSATVTVGGTSFHKSLRIETVKPNRLKVDLGLKEGQVLTSNDGPITLRSHWLHGAPARDLKARVTVTTTKGSPKFKGLEGFIFEDLRTSVSEEERVVFDGQLNSNGETSVQLDLKPGNNAPAVINANIVTRVFEAGGDASMDRIMVPYHPYSSYAAIKAPTLQNAWASFITDTTYRFVVASVDASGKALAGRELKAQIYRMDWNWWWDGGMSGPANYISSSSIQLRKEIALRTDAKGRTTLDFRVDRPEWGRFAIRITDPESGHSTAAQIYVDWPGWEGRARRAAPEQAAMLRFNSDKENYAVGDQAILTIPSAGNGRALVSFETGSRVLDAVWVNLKEKETKYTFTVTADMVPNVYAHVAVVQPHALTLNDLPIRLYGVIPIQVEDPSTRLTPTIAILSPSTNKSLKEIRTDQAFAVEVGEAAGERMSYTLAIVDEGLLDITRFKTPDPWKHFFAREALGVRTWDNYNDVIGSFGRRIQRLLAMGGSDEPDRTNAARAQRFKPVVRFVGPFTLEPGRKAKHNFTISNYVGSVRVMVVATDANHAYGKAEQAVPVRKPLMLLATMPRVLAAGELVDLPVTVFAMDAKVKEVQVALELDRMLIAEGPASRTIRFNTTGDQVVTFKVRVKEAIGVTKLKVIATGAGEQASESIELQVRQPNMPSTEVLELLLEPGKSWSETPKPLGILGTNSAYLELSSIPPVDLGRRLQYLIGYPHGCLEQITSKAFPQLYIAAVMDLPARTAHEMRSNVEAAIGRIARYQRTDGSFNYWSGGDHYDAWSSIYASHFLVEAERQGFSVPASMRSSWLTYQRKAARSWSTSVPDGWTTASIQLVQAYRLYVLALASSPEIGAMNRLREQNNLGLQASWMLAAAYAKAGRQDVSRQLVEKLTTTVPSYNEQGNTFGSTLRDDALVAEAFHAMGEPSKAAGVIQRIAKQLNSDNWHSTQSTAFGLMAVARIAESNKGSQMLSYTLDVGGRSDPATTTKPMARKDLPTPDGKTRVSLTNTGQGLLYLRLVRTGTPMPGEERASQSGLNMQVEYQLMDGTEIDPAHIEQGTDLKAVVRINHPGVASSYQNLALTQVFPSGWEIRNMRLEGTEEAVRNSPWTYRDQRDDRVMTYFDLTRGKTLTYIVLLNASYTGRYYMPGAHLQAMYDHTVNAQSQGKWVEVVPIGGTTASR